MPSSKSPKPKLRTSFVGKTSTNSEVIWVKLDQNILLQGQISSREIINDFYKKSDIFILPSYTEGFPRVIYTAMEYGLPIITTMVGGIPSVMKDEYNCLNVRVGSSDDIKNTIVKLIKNDDLFKKLKINSQKKIRQIISNEEIKIHEDILINFLKTQWKRAVL